ncbi:MAG: hypothetical protein E7Z64_01450 [Thermoplasmata archaeon]|nr:hypothetical protein [Thermoplasmata archaeon]
MTSTIESKMTVCDKFIRVSATQKDDGTFDIVIDSDCDALKYFSQIGNVSMDDIMNFETSKINKEEVRGNMSMICVAPIMVYQACWMECGMMSKRIYPKMGPITIDMAKD